MPTHDIIDNRQEKLVDHINRMLDSTEIARFAVGYFFLSGLESIAERLEGVKELCLLIGDTTNRATLDQLAEGYQRLELVQEMVEAQAYPRRIDMVRMANETAHNVRAIVEQMDQTDQCEVLVKTLVRMIEEKRLKVRIYTKGRLHAKAYIFDYYAALFDHLGKPIERHEKGIAIIGSSNLTLSGLSQNTELNVVVQGNDNHAALVAWFDVLWNEAQDFNEILMREMQQSWAVVPMRPYDIYMKTLYTLVKDRIEGAEEHDILWDDEITSRLADFQKVAVRQAVQIIRDFGGAFVSDVVGLGKSYIGAAIVKHFERTEHARPLIICPAHLVEMWERSNEVYQLNARVISMGYLREDGEGNVNFLLKDVRYRDRDFVLIDESHNLRHSGTQRYKVVQTFLATGRRCCFLTATPRNKSAWDVYAQIKLFHQDDMTDLPNVTKSKQKQEPYVTMQRAGTNLRGLIRVLLFKRFESSVYAFQETVRRLLKMHNAFLLALLEGLVPAGEEAQAILYESDYAEEQELVDALSAVSGRYKATDFDVTRLQEHIKHDIRLFEKILSLVEPISPEQDDKLQTLKRRLTEAPFRDGKRLIFTQYADTDRYLFENLNPAGAYADIEVIYSGDKSKARAVGRFAPLSNPEYRLQGGEAELNTLIATDVLAEGLNMQDCDKIINYDLHWNPVRLIQRFGRIDRIGSEHAKIYNFNFLPEIGIEKHLGLRQKLHNRIQEIHDTIGEDSAILDATEQLNEDAMYAIYKKNGGQLNLFEDEEEFLDLNEAEELLRQVRKEDPAEYERIARLQDGIRSMKYSGQQGTYVFCQAGRYQQLFLVNEQGNILSRDIPRILGVIKATPETIQGVPPKDYNQMVMHVKGLLKSLGQIYFQHNMREWVEHRTKQVVDRVVPRIICSEGLI